MRARSMHTAALGATIAILAVVAPAVRLGAVPAARAGAASSSACTTTSGVTVIVDFTHFGRNIERGCAPGSPATALAAMHAAGFETAGTTRYGDAFLCRIENLPAPKNEACGDTPPANTSWSFYYAQPGDAVWTYSRTGVLSYQPAPGSAVAFAFGNYAKPGIRPAAAIPPPPPTTRFVEIPAPTSPPVTALIAPTTTAPLPTTARPPTSAATASPHPSTSRATTATRSTPTTSTAPRIVDRTASGSTLHDDAGSPLPALLGAALVVVLAVGTGVTIRSRRRRSV